MTAVCHYLREDTLLRMQILKHLAWPCAFTRFTCSANEFVATYTSNYIHAVCGDWVHELRTVAELLGIEAHNYDEK
jgi:L-fucose isomerase, C-terminal domain